VLFIAGGSCGGGGRGGERCGEHLFEEEGGGLVSEGAVWVEVGVEEHSAAVEVRLDTLIAFGLRTGCTRQTNTIIQPVEFLFYNFIMSFENILLLN
jgi:hypothetical protein